MERTTRVPDAVPPSVLVVGCRGALLASCREAASNLDVEVVPCDLLSLTATAASLRPLAIIILADIYGFDGEEFDALARSVGAQRILAEPAEPVSRLTDRLHEAVTEAMAARAAPLAPSQRSTPPRRTRSGIRWSAMLAMSKSA